MRCCVCILKIKTEYRCERVRGRCMAHETVKLQGYLKQTQSKYSTIAAEVDTSVQQRNSLNAEINRLSQQIDGTELEMSNVQIELDNIHIPDYDEDDPEGSMAAIRQAEQERAMLQARLNALAAQAQRLRQEREGKKAELKRVQEALQKLKAYCSDRINALSVLRAAFLENAQTSLAAAQPLARMASGVRFGAAAASGAANSASARAAENRRGAEDSARLIQMFQQLIEKIDGGQRERER